MHTEEVKPKEVEEETANGIHAVTGADNNSNDFTVALAQMSEEDQKVCLDLRDTITSKIDASPDRLCFITVNTDENARLTALHDVRSLPTFVTYHRGRIVGRVEGAKQEKVLELILQLLKVDDGSEEQPKPFSEEQ
ncbi:hypothetical protein AGDE_00321 [Angomonas deanei]|uniref:Thioredoxin, putative n=1 Tax=Angomonas deanei TaxID=59799 RepID=A0A7G2CFE6_9TRYP|nr:hypothetical protein AGDE_00321 [Angomonas deanei]CAD2218550.1 Thioredoxin, putative [Angomonas deanei]|eukprot:EPY43600.1 hypothetical protein AGDE_00321 [Angomonas deanei]